MFVSDESAFSGAYAAVAISNSHCAPQTSSGVLESFGVLDSFGGPGRGRAEEDDDALEFWAVGRFFCRKTSFLPFSFVSQVLLIPASSVALPLYAS